MSKIEKALVLWMIYFDYPRWLGNDAIFEIALASTPCIPLHTLLHARES
jgi:hypothetical protein